MDLRPQFRLLGPVECWGADGRIDLGPLKQRTVLAALLADTGRVVTQETLIERVWDDAPPAEVRNVLYTYVTRLRRILAAASTANPTTTRTPKNGEPAHATVRLVRRSGGYLLEADPDFVDVHRLRTLTAKAKSPGLEDAERSRLFRAALTGTEGVPLADLTCAWATRTREHLIRQRGDALIGYAAVETRLGRPGAAIDELYQALVDQPLAEELVASLMTALHHAGRTAEALEVFARARSTIAAELGVEPGAELRRLHEDILRGTLSPVCPAEPNRAPLASTRERQEPVVANPPVSRRHRHWAAGSAAMPTPVARPHMLPAQIDHFAGRPVEEAAIATALTETVQPSAAIVAVIGASGLGKSALALHVAHLLREAFPDGQLYAELHGSTDPAMAARTTQTAQILVRFLRALGVPSGTLPESVEELAELYRGALAGRRVLVVLDGVADEEQVAPLLPGAADCGVLITSRDHLAGIGCTRVIVDVLCEAEAIRLLAAVTGEDRVRAEPHAAKALTELCGRLPIAVRIAGARLLTRPHWPIERLVARLSDESGRLDELVHGRMAVRDALDHGYRSLDNPARTLFRALGRTDVDHFDARLAADLLGVDEAAADDALDQLVAARMVRPAGRHDQDRQDRPCYRLGGLARLYARDRAEVESTDCEPVAALSLDLSRDTRRSAVAGCHLRGTSLLRQIG